MALRNAFEDLSTEATQADVKTAVQSVDGKTPALVGGAVPVTISGTGIATDTKQDTGNTSLASIDTKTPALVGGAVPVTLGSGAATAANQATGNTSLASIDGKTPALVGGAVPVTLGSGAATSAKQDTGNTSLASIDTKTPALGQALAAASTPVVLTASQLSTLTPPAAISGFATQTTLASIDTRLGSALPLPTGAATDTKQDTGNTSLASIDTKTPALGQALAAASTPVVLTAIQVTALTPPAAISGFATETTLAAIDTKLGSALPLPTGAATAALQGALTETAPASDTASSGLNGRLQRIAQRLTSLMALLPGLGSQAMAGSQAVTLATDDTQVGAKTSASVISSGGSGLMGWLSDSVTQLKSLVAFFSQTGYTDSYRLPVDQRDGFAVSGSATALGVLFTQDLIGYESISVQTTSAGTSCVISYECSDDNANWVNCSGLSSGAIGGTSTTLSATTFSTTVISMLFSKKARYFRARVSTYVSGTVSVVGTLHKSPAAAVISASGMVNVQGPVAHAGGIGGQPLRIAARALTANYTAVATAQVADIPCTLVGALIEKPYSIPEADWHYPAPTAGILSNTTTAVTIAAAAGAGLRNYITSMDLSSDVFTTPSVIAIRDGAAGTVIWSAKIATSGLVNGRLITFASPLKSTANTLLEIVTLTASGAGAVWPNVHGYIAP